MIKPMDVTPEVSEALAHLRTYAAKYPTMGLSAALNVLDNKGVFAEIDEANDYASAEEILAEVAENGFCSHKPVTALDGQNESLGYTHCGLCGVRMLDPGEWGDTTSADMAQHQGFTQDSARALFGDTEPQG